MKYVKKTALIATIDELTKSGFINSPSILSCDLCLQTSDDYDKKWFIGNIGMDNEITICEGCLDSIQKAIKQ